LQKLINDAQQGKIVVILDDQKQAVQLVPMTTTQARKAGSARDQVKVLDNFDALITDFDGYS